jgi:hypothetical protein
MQFLLAIEETFVGIATKFFQKTLLITTENFISEQNFFVA